MFNLEVEGKTDINLSAVIKKNEILSSAAKWMELEDIILSEISQTQRDKYCVFSSIRVRYFL
jgi:hypothetical protein